MSVNLEEYITRWLLIFVQGKGTQCAKLVEDFGFAHLSGRPIPLCLMYTEEIWYSW